MSVLEDFERLRRLALTGDRGARDELVRHLRRHNGLDDQVGTVYRVTISEDAERWRVDLTNVKIDVTVYDTRLLAYVGRKTVDQVDIIVVPIWGDPPREAPVMDLTLVVGKRHYEVRAGGPERSPLTGS